MDIFGGSSKPTGKKERKTCTDKNQKPSVRKREGLEF